MPLTMDHEMIYLTKHNIYQRQLLRLAEQGLVFVAYCTQDGCEGIPEGFRTLEAAAACAKRRERPYAHDKGERKTSDAHAVYQLVQDEDGCWMCSYEDVR